MYTLHKLYVQAETSLTCVQCTGVLVLQSQFWDIKHPIELAAQLYNKNFVCVCVIETERERESVCVWLCIFHDIRHTLVCDVGGSFWWPRQVQYELLVLLSWHDCSYVIITYDIITIIVIMMMIILLYIIIVIIIIIIIIVIFILVSSSPPLAIVESIDFRVPTSVSHRLDGLVVKASASRIPLAPGFFQGRVMLVT